LKKRENFREAFVGFDFEKLVHFKPKDVERLLKNEGIIRHRGKIEAVIHNAACTLRLRDEQGSLWDYFKNFAAHTKAPQSKEHVPAITPESEALSKDLRRRGFKFVGPTTLYAHMQATGLVNDHLEDCFVRPEVEQVRRRAKL
jgi:DNA-3-methyladenine glycosylase I